MSGPPPAPPPGRRRPARLTLRLLALGGTALVLVLALALLRWPDRRSAWQQASLTRDLPEANAPDQGGLWSDRVGALLAEADLLGAPPADPARLRPWLEAQCRLNRRLQALQRQFRRPVETAAAMGRPPACERLAGLQDP